MLPEVSAVISKFKLGLKSQEVIRQSCSRSLNTSRCESLSMAPLYSKISDSPVLKIIRKREVRSSVWVFRTKKKSISFSSLKEKITLTFFSRLLIRQIFKCLSEQMLRKTFAFGRYLMFVIALRWIVNLQNTLSSWCTCKNKMPPLLNPSAMHSYSSFGSAIAATRVRT